MTGVYALGRDYAAATRLNAQYYMWKETLGFDVHPDIPTARSEVLDQQPIHIADVGCGTAIWLRSVAQSLPHARLDGFDISLAQCPPLPWLPQNIRSLREWDVYQAPPVELQGRYDIVHARLLFVVVRDGDTTPMIRNMMLLLKPGGYLQWDELNVAQSYVLKVDETVPAAIMEETLGTLSQVGYWVAKLAETMERCGLVHARISSYEERTELAMPFFDINLAKDMEMAETKLKGTADGEALRSKVKLMHVESKAGAVICTPKLVCVAQASEQTNIGDASSLIE
ncbi:MAG: hypothetical protein Q9192_001069 [Flavoplaca navasiana]